MKIIEGNAESLPRNVLVEQDGNYFFVMARHSDNYEPALLVVDTETPVGFDLESARAAQNIVRAYLTGLGITATFDY